MRSGTPKPLHRLCGRPMVLHVLDALAELTVERVVVVVGHGAPEVSKTIQAEAPPDLAIEFVEQPEPRGTGDAVAVALTGFPVAYGADLDDGDVIVLPGDTPLLRPATLAPLVDAHRASEAAATLLTAVGAIRPATRGSFATRTAGWRASSTSATPADDERLIDEVATTRLLLPPRRPRPGAAQAVARQLAGRVLPDRHHRGAPRRRLRRHHGRGRRPRRGGRGQRPRPARRAPRPSCGRRINERWMRRGVTMWDPERDLSRLVGAARGGRDAAPRCHPRGQRRRWPRRRSSVPRATSSTARSGPAPRVTHTVASHAVIGEHCTVGPYVVLEAGDTVRARRAVRAILRTRGSAGSG